jgi:hypothetical protein
MVSSALVAPEQWIEISMTRMKRNAVLDQASKEGMRLRIVGIVYKIANPNIEYSPL